MAGLWCASSTRLRCAQTLWTVAERPSGSDLFGAKCFGASSKYGLEDVDFEKLHTRRGRCSEGGGDRDGRLRIAALTNGRAVVRVLGSASLRADAVDRRRAPSRVGSIWGEKFGARRRVHIRHANPPSADGERQSLYFAHAMCTDCEVVA